MDLHQQKQLQKRDSVRTTHRFVIKLFIALIRQLVHRGASVEKDQQVLHGWVGTVALEIFYFQDGKT